MHWVDKLTSNRVPAGPIWSVPEALSHPQISNRGLLTKHCIDDEDLQLVGIGAKFNGSAPRVMSPPPKLGEHTSEILKELGYTSTQIQDLEHEGVT